MFDMLQQNGCLKFQSVPLLNIVGTETAQNSHFCLKSEFFSISSECLTLYPKYGAFY